MSILSNYTPNCIVKAKVSCPINKLGPFKNMKEEEFAKKFLIAIKIAKTDEYRAVTHNKGIMNGIDAIAMATGNDLELLKHVLMHMHVEVENILVYQMHLLKIRFQFRN